jgi:hypothetical protein
MCLPPCSENLNFGRKSSAEECLRVGAAKGAAEVVFGVSGIRANECWLQNSAQDKRPHANFSCYSCGNGGGAVSTPSPAPSPHPNPGPARFLLTTPMAAATRTGPIL